ncbi:MAG: 13E12 repeat family protein, partial [Microlunatus sp.]|nr:13E12 repeat family protein [Microlunatus sp.]
MSDSTQVDCAEAEALAGKICAAAALSAQSECQLLELVGEFDAVDAVRWWDGVKSLAHWLSWCCSMSPGTAREHVRVARALRRMPTITEAFRQGRLSYSKVREVTRVVDLVEEAEVCELALTATASQLARMVAGYRRA